MPVSPGEITSQAGWQPGPRDWARWLPGVVRRLKAQGIRVSLFVDAEAGADSLGGVDRRRPRRAVHRAVRAGVRAGAAECAANPSRAMRRRPALAHALGLGVNAGHDLDLANLVLFRELPFLAEVSIGHAIISRALFVGLSSVVREYLDADSAPTAIMSVFDEI